MSLQDRYDRGGDGRLENLDRHLTRLADRFGNHLATRTGLARHTLTQIIYVVSAWAGTQHLALVHDPMMIAFIGFALMGMVGITQVSRGGVVEQMQTEVLGLPKQTFVALRLFVLVLGLFGLAIAAGNLASALVNRTWPPFTTWESLLSGSCITALQLGDYIRRTNPFTPSGRNGFRI